MKQADVSNPMTDVMPALAALNDLDLPERDAALEAFHDRWKDEPLVLDKWFSLKTSAARPDTLKVLTGLMDHPGFQIRNPNRVRALFGGFTMMNPTGFHAKDGSGYAFLADRVLEIDGFNSQLASRLCQPLVRWRRFDTDRQSLMKDALRRIVAQPTLSKDVFEIADKALDGA